MGWAEYADVYIPQGQFIVFSIGQFQIGSSNWTTAVCNENAIARWLYSSPDSSQFSIQRSQFNWKKDSTCHSTNSTPPQNNNQEIYIVQIQGYDENGNLLPAHAVTAVPKGPNYDLTEWQSYTFMQYDNNDIQIGDTTDPCGFAQIPVGSGNYWTQISIESVTGIQVNDSDPNNPSIAYTPSSVATFSIDNLGDVHKGSTP